MKEADVTLCGHGSGTPRITSAAKYNSYRYSQIVNKDGKTWRKGIICVLRPKGMTDTLRKAYHDKYKTILGRNHYSQDKRGYCYIPYSDGKYYSDCSSSQCLTLKAIGLPIPNYNTEGMYDSSAFTRLDIKIEKGHIVEPEKLKVGDQILYAGANPDRAEREYVGHVEGVYAIGGSEQSAKLMGLPVGRTKVLVYGFNGLCSVLAGITYALYVKSGWNLSLQGAELDVITCAVIGGTLLTGGVGYMIGTLFGVMLKALIPALITFNGNLLSWWGKIATGLLLLLFICIQKIVVRTTDHRKNKKKEPVKG